jgi:choline monooxygenase
MRLIQEGCSKRKRMICPYHTWAYGLDGRLQRTPNIGGPRQHAPDKAGVSLPEGLEPVRLMIWHRLIFVNLSGDAPPFEEHIRPLAERWARYDFSVLRRGESAVVDVDCNWKLAVENFIDVYHVPYVHPGLSRWNKVTDRYYINERGLFGQGNPNVLPADAAYGKMPTFPGLSEAELGISEALCLFPNLLITVFCDHLRIIIVEPLAAGKSRERVEIFVVGESALDAERAAYRRMLLDRFQSFNSEDIELIAELQKSMVGSSFRDAFFSPFWDVAVMRFQARIHEAVGGNGHQIG